MLEMKGMIVIFKNNMNGPAKFNDTVQTKAKLH